MPAQSSSTHDAPNFPVFPFPSDSPSAVLPKALAIASTDVSVQGQQQLMLKELGEKVPELEWDFFMTNILPLPTSLPKTVTLQRTMANLEKKSALLTLKGGRQVWKEFKDGDPTVYAARGGKDGKENAIFKKLEAIVSSIKDASGWKKQAPRLFRCNPDRTPISENRDNNTRPDGYYLRNHGSGSVQVKNPLWSNVVVPSEFKIHDTQADKNKNWTQILWSLTHIMREDPTRRFVIGFTIERRDLRIWFASRSDILVSTPINFLADFDRVVDFFLRLQFADDQDLGYDMTITRAPGLDATGRVQYDIEVDGKLYRTQRLISSIGAEWTRGRGTRVWEVKELDEHGREKPTSRILKDSWGDTKRKGEADILRSIHASAAGEPKIAEKLEKSLLSRLESWDVTVKVLNDTQIDSTRTVMMRGATPEFQTTLDVVKDFEARVPVPQDNPAEGTMSQVSAKPAHVVYGEKKHHRIIFEEVGTTIADVGSLSKAFGYLAQVSLALYALHTVGWVHRDISSGNIIIYDDRAILGDIEYAKQEEDTTRHDVRTGTAFFMAAEVNSCKYLHMGVDFALRSRGSAVPQPHDGPKRMHKYRTFEPAEPPKNESTSAQADLDQKLKFVFRHNPLHDLESVFWLALYLLLCTLLDLQKPLFMSDADWEKYSTAKDVLAADLFHGSEKRIECITADVAFATMLPGLHPRIREICKSLDRLRAALTTAYKFAERDPGCLKFGMIMDIALPLPSRPDLEPMPLHHIFANTFLHISRSLSENGDITFRKIPSISEQRRMMHDLLLQQQNQAGAKAPNAARTTGDIAPVRRTRARNAEQPRTEDPDVATVTRRLRNMRPRD